MSSTAKTVKFSGARKTEMVELPSYKDSQVTLYKSLTVSEQQVITAKYPDTQNLNQHEQTEMAILMLTQAIKEWNFTGEDDQPLEINDANLRKFDVIDILKMCEVPMGTKLLDGNNKPLGKDPLAQGGSSS